MEIVLLALFVVALIVGIRRNLLLRDARGVIKQFEAQNVELLNSVAHWTSQTAYWKQECQTSEFRGGAAREKVVELEAGNLALAEQLTALRNEAKKPAKKKAVAKKGRGRK